MEGKFEIHPTTSIIVQGWMAANDVEIAGKPFAIMRRDRNENLQVWSWHVSELSAKRAIQNAARNRVVR
jgi:hypothetical protein